MMKITHNEVRRHPRWREEPGTPVPEAPRLPGARLLGIAVVLIVVVAIVVVILKGWLLSTLRD